jgi:hypothetical protein
MDCTRCSPARLRGLRNRKKPFQRKVRLNIRPESSGRLRRDLVPPTIPSIAEASAIWISRGRSGGNWHKGPAGPGYADERRQCRKMVPEDGVHPRLRGLPGGAEGIRTDGYRGHSEISIYSSVRPLMRCSRPAPSRSRSTPSQRVAAAVMPLLGVRVGTPELNQLLARTVDQPFVCQARKDRFGADCRSWRGAAS